MNVLSDWIAPIEPVPLTLERHEYARLRTVEDLAGLLVDGHRHGFPLGDGTESEAELIDRLEQWLPMKAQAMP